jgi:thioester reductase-like protein
MIELLRHCLLHASDISVTQFVRSDTERSALARLPGNLPGRALLEELLVETELVHYGGRDLPKERFAALLGNARRLLNERPPVHA